MRYASVCSGIEAPSVAWEPLGWRPQFFSEIEAFPSAVLAHHYGSNMPGDPLPSNGVPNHGDMTNFKEWPDAAIDVLVGGTPCQSFSVAGLRAGLADPRGNLALTFLAIADRYRPRWILWENVPGVLSSGDGRDFGAFLGALGQLGYGWAYRVVDAQYCRVDGFGRAVPQRRRRVFVVGCLGSWAGAAAVLFEPEGMRGHSPPRREAGQGATPILEAGARTGVSTSDPRAGTGIGEPGDPMFTLQAGKQHAVGVAPTISARPTGGGGLGTDFDCDGDLVIHSLRGEGFDASEDRTGRGTPLVPVGITIHGTDKTARVASMTEVAGSLRTKPPGSQENSSSTAVLAPIAPPFAATLTRGAESAGKGGYAGRRREDDVNLVAAPIAFDPTQITSPTNRSQPQPGGPCHTLAKGQHAPAVAFNPQAGGKQTSLGYDPSSGITGTMECNQIPALAHGRAVRRLTPVECARLQGFPDDYLDVLHRGKPAADGPKYKALGNSMAVNVVRWIGKRIDAVDKIMRGADQ